MLDPIDLVCNVLGEHVTASSCVFYHICWGRGRWSRPRTTRNSSARWFSVNAMVAEKYALLVATITTGLPEEAEPARSEAAWVFCHRHFKCQPFCFKAYSFPESKELRMIYGRAEAAQERSHPDLNFGQQIQVEILPLIYLKPYSGSFSPPLFN